MFRIARKANHSSETPPQYRSSTEGGPLQEQKKTIATATVSIITNQYQIQSTPQDRKKYSLNTPTPFITCSPLRSDTPEAYSNRQIDEDNERKGRRTLTRSSTPLQLNLTNLTNDFDNATINSENMGSHKPGFDSCGKVIDQTTNNNTYQPTKKHRPIQRHWEKIGRELWQ